MAAPRAATVVLCVLVLLHRATTALPDGGEDLLNLGVRAALHVREAPCLEQLLQYLRELGNFTLWAVRMFDSSAKFPDSITSGAAYHLGNFDTCLDIDDGNNLRGRYCLARVQFKPVMSETRAGSAWDKLKAHSDRLKIRRDVFHSAVCVPSACGPQDVALLFQGLLSTAPLLSEHATFQVDVSEDMCYTKEEVAAGVAIPTSAWVAVIVFLSVIALSTIRDITHPDHDARTVRHGSWGTVFSLRRHWRTLTTHPVQDGKLYIPCLDGLRTVALLIVVAGHRGEATMAGPVINGDAIEKYYENLAEALIMNGHLVVDTFFTVSGYLLCWNYLSSSGDGNKRTPNIFLNFANRYVRLCPAMMAVIVFETFFLYNLLSGPLWKLKVGSELKNCRRNWWTNALLINNYVQPQSPCVDTAWYAACDFQIFIVACILLECVGRFKKYGYLLMSAAVASSVAVTATLTYLHDLDPTMIPDQSVLGHSYNDTYLLTYITAYCRSGPYFVGMLFAYWLFTMKAKKLKIHKIVLSLGWILSPVVAILVIAAGFLFYSSFQVDKLLIAAYSGLHRPLFGMCVAFLITACAMDNGGVVAKVLEWKPFRPFSRLTYCIYLVHYMVQMVRAGNLRTPKIISDFDMFCDFIADMVLSLMLALILFVTVEQPGIMLWNKIISARSYGPGEFCCFVSCSQKDNGHYYVATASKYFFKLLSRMQYNSEIKKSE